MYIHRFKLLYSAIAMELTMSNFDAKDELYNRVLENIIVRPD